MVGCQLAASPWNSPLLSYYAIKDMTTTYFSYWLLFIGVVQLCLFVCLFICFVFFFGVGRNGEKSLSCKFGVGPLLIGTIISPCH
jgi:hypothetical protein